MINFLNEKLKLLHTFVNTVIKNNLTCHFKCFRQLRHQWIIHQWDME